VSLPEGAHRISYSPTGEILTPTLPVLPNKLARHVKLYGKAGSEQWYGSRERSKVESKVIELRKQGLVPAAIADRLGISDRRVKRYLKAA
jgi:hypothetical protein